MPTSRVLPHQSSWAKGLGGVAWSTGPSECGTGGAAQAWSCVVDSVVGVVDSVAVVDSIPRHTPCVCLKRELE